MKCQVHDCEMEWMPSDSHPDGGSWYCEECWCDEEAMFVENDDEYLDNLNHLMTTALEVKP